MFLISLVRIKLHCKSLLFALFFQISQAFEVSLHWDIFLVLQNAHVAIRFYLILRLSSNSLNVALSALSKYFATVAFYVPDQ